MIAIIDYNTGNICSVLNALTRIGANDCILTADADIIRRATHVLLPGVGEAATAMNELHSRKLDTLIPTLTQPVLGICIGTQLMCLSSEEGDATCMGIFPTRVVRFPEAHPDANGSMLKIPHMGWNDIHDLHSDLFHDVNDGSFVYYVHSYYPEPCSCTAAHTTSGVPFSGALHRDNFYGTQVHPEKSGRVGEQILRNFLSL